MAGQRVALVGRHGDAHRTGHVAVAVGFDARQGVVALGLAPQDAHGQLHRLEADTDVFAVFLAVGLLWWWGASLAGSPLVFPGPQAVLPRFLELQGWPLWSDVLHSGGKVLAVLFFVVFLGVPLGVLLGLNPGLYEAFRLRPTFAEVPPSPLPEHGETSVRVEEAINAASVRVRSVGRESVAHLTRVTRDLCLRRVDVIRMALPLEDPGTPELCGAMEEQGYFFAGIFPEGHREHKLLLQYLNNVEWDDQKIQVFGPLTQELLAYVRGCDPHGRS